MICKDCEQEVDKLTKNGICKKCNTRLNQQNYLNKKNGTNIPYVPIRELKESNPNVYSRLMGRRSTSNKISKPKKVSTKILSEDVITVSNKKDEQIEKIVEENLNRAWTEKECLLDSRNETSMYSLFLGLLNEIVTGKFAEDSAKMLSMISVTDRYKSDVEHKMGNCKFNTVEGLQRFIEHSKELHFILNKRRSIKDAYDDRLALMKVATALKDAIGEDLIEGAIKQLEQLQEFRKDPKYCPVVDDYMSKEYDWAYERNIDKPLYVDSDKVKKANAHMYLVSCDVIGYKHSKVPQEFTRRVYTTSEDLAKNEWKDYMAKNLKGVTYKESDIKATIID